MHAKIPSHPVSLFSPTVLHRRFLRWWSWMICIALVLYFVSFTNLYIRAFYVVVLLMSLGAGCFYLRQFLWRYPVFRLPTLLLILGVAAWMMSAGRAPNTDRLRGMYVSCLRSFTGTLYIWGGETHVGIDCSGLARTALCEAMVLEGMREGNPRLFGPMLWKFWWQDMSAKGLYEGKNGYTHPVGSADGLSPADLASLRPGDLGIAGNGFHVLIYLGNRKWIEADPAPRKVVIVTADSPASKGWRSYPITVMRWWVLEEGEEVYRRAVRSS